MILVPRRIASGWTGWTMSRGQMGFWYNWFGRKEGNVLFNDALNTFYLRLYDVRHMVKDHSVREETRCRHMGYSFRLTARVLLYAPSHRQDNTYHGLCYTSCGALAGTRNSSLGPLHDGSIRWPITPWANALTMPLVWRPLTVPWQCAPEGLNTAVPTYYSVCVSTNHRELGTDLGLFGIQGANLVLQLLSGILGQLQILVQSCEETKRDINHRLTQYNKCTTDYRLDNSYNYF